METTTLRELIADWRIAKDLHDMAKATASDLAKIVQHKAEKVRSRLQAEKLRNVRCDDGATVYLHNILSVSVTAENEQEIRAWLIDEFGDDQPFVAEHVNKTAVTDRIKEALANDEIGEFDVPRCMKLNQHPDVRMRKN